MEAEMQGLSLSMENISAKSDAINASLETHRSKLEHLSTVNRLLQKVFFLFFIFPSPSLLSLSLLAHLLFVLLIEMVLCVNIIVINASTNIL